MITALGTNITNPIISTTCTEHTTLYGAESTPRRTQNLQPQQEQTTGEDYVRRFQNLNIYIYITK